ncbi:MAG: hypothetical protein EOO48_06200 [Flavobacterium sp.]|nr:MAG: hypothetical protein EOO48_06200 [Flavobacterium sp.]
MKKFMMFSLLGLFFVSCSSDDSGSGPELVSSPDAKAAYDNSNFGIYKGVFVGSSGVVFIDINNNGALTATMNIDGTTHNFTTTETTTEGSAINGLTFTSGSMSFDFNVDNTGDSPYLTNMNFPGHPNADVYLLKEYSDALVECYKGTFSGDDSGVFNLIISDGEIYGLAKSDGDDSALEIDGSVTGSNISGTFENGGFVGTKSGNSVSGTWQNIANESGNFSGQRKL